MIHKAFQPQRKDIDDLMPYGMMFDHPWQVVDRFETLLAEFFGARYAVATDCCTHALELCLRLQPPQQPISVPRHTYMSVPMMLDKLNIDYVLESREWSGFYELSPGIYDAATLWRGGAYQPGTMMCLSFQFKKQLPIGRGGLILLDDAEAWARLQRMVRDGRDRTLTQFEDNPQELGYHYYMTPEDAARGIELFLNLGNQPARTWTHLDYRDLMEFDYFKERDVSKK